MAAGRRSSSPQPAETGLFERSGGAPRGEALLTVGELARRIQSVLEQGLGLVWVVGEISNFHQHDSGHCYFTLKDAEAQVSAVMFRSAASRLRFRPDDGLEVIALGRVRFYDRQGKLQLYVESLEPRGLGALRLALEQLRERLAAEGLLAAERKRPLPFLPRCVGIVTAPGGAALQDMLRMLRDRYRNLRVVVRPVRVQGLGAELEIAGGIRDLQGVPDLDVLIVGRGGGSIEDLWAFNDEGVARAIAACRVPVVSAVGHEIDVTIADLVADVRAPTPTAVAELVVPSRQNVEAEIDARLRGLVGALSRSLAGSRRAVAALRARLRDPRRDVVLGRARATEVHRRLVRAATAALAGSRDRVATLAERLRQATPGRRMDEHRTRLAQARGLAVARFGHRLEIARGRVGTVAASLSGLSPLAVLERGYAVVWKAGESRALRTAVDVVPGDALSIRLYRGSVEARVVSRDASDPDAGKKA